MEFSLHKDFSDLAPQAVDWNTLLAESVNHIPFLRHEYLSAWWATRGGGEWPESELAVVTAHQDGRLVGIAPLFSAKNRDGQAALLLLGSIEISDYLDIIVRPADLPVFIAGLLDYLARPTLPDWRLLDWHNLPEASPTLPVLKAAGSYLSRSFHPLTGRFRNISGRDR